MKGMEIFNTDDLSEDFMEVGDDLMSGTEIDKQNLLASADEDDDTKAKSEDSEIDGNVDNDDGKLEVLLPPSGTSEENAEEIEPNSSTLNPKFFSSLVQALKEGGILDGIEDDEVKSEEDFLKVIDETVKQREYADLADTQKEYLEALRNGIPHEEIAQYQRAQVEYDSITDEALEADTEEAEALRKEVIKFNLTSKGVKPERADKLTEKLVESGEDIAEAKDSILEIKANSKAAFEAKAQQKASEAQARADAEAASRSKLDEIAKDTKEIVPGLKIPINITNKVVKGLTQPVGYTDDNKPLDIISKYLHENPIEGRFKLGYLLEVTDGLKKMNVLENKKAKKSAFNDLEAALRFKESGGKLDQEDQFQKGFNLDDWNFE